MWLPTLCMSVCNLPPPPIHVVLKTMCLHLPCSSHDRSVTSVYTGHELLSTLDIKFYKITKQLFPWPKEILTTCLCMFSTSYIQLFHVFSESAVDVEHYIHDKSIRRRLILLSLSNSKFGMSQSGFHIITQCTHNIIISIFLYLSVCMCVAYVCLKVDAEPMFCLCACY